MTDILGLIDAEIANLQQARAVIGGATTKRKPGRPAKSATVAVKPKKKRKMSVEGRARLVAAVKARWAKAKAKKAAAK